MKTKSYIPLIIITLSQFGFGHDGIFWSLEIKFKIETEDAWRTNLLDDFEFLINNRCFDRKSLFPMRLMTKN